MHKLTRTVSRSALLIAALVIAPAAFAANAVVDGDFNNSISGFTTFSGGSTLPGGPWVVTGGSVDLIGNFWQSPSGPTPPNGSVDLDGVSQGGVEQTISGLIPGDTYVLTFSLSGNRGACDSTASTDTTELVTPDAGVTYAWDGSQYHYNWSTKGLSAGEYLIYANLADGSKVSYVDICLTK